MDVQKRNEELMTQTGIDFLFYKDAKAISTLGSLIDFPYKIERIIKHSRLIALVGWLVFTLLVCYLTGSILVLLVYFILVYFNLLLLILWRLSRMILYEYWGIFKGCFVIADRIYKDLG
ncbi:MAG: hypothetical protein AAF734_07975 [Bacteroidota bacterium]